MAGESEEQFIRQYEHITRLNLLTDEELKQLKRKRSFFEVSIKNSSEIKNYINYIKYEIALMKKFDQIDIQNKSDARALDKAIKTNVMNLFRLSSKKFQGKRKIWENFLTFAKQKSPFSVSGIYQEMLHFHHQVEDFIEAAQHEISKKNYQAAMNLLEMGMGKHKESCQKLVAVYIECSIKQGNNEDEKQQQSHLLQAATLYEKYLKNFSQVSCHCEMLQKIQNFEYSMGFQNDVLTHLLQNFAYQAEVWQLLATRHLSGLVFIEQQDDSIRKTEDGQILPKHIAFHVRLTHCIGIYEKSLDSVGSAGKKEMLSFIIEKLLELDAAKTITNDSLKIIRQALGKTFLRGYEEDALTEQHYILFLKLRSINMKRNWKEVELMFERGFQLYPNSKEFADLSTKRKCEVFK